MFTKLTENKPALNQYCLVEHDGYISISQWVGNKFDIQPDSKMPWFRPNERVRKNVQPTSWKELPIINDY